jgi:hypothetical protein
VAIPALPQLAQRFEAESLVAKAREADILAPGDPLLGSSGAVLEDHLAVEVVLEEGDGVARRACRHRSDDLLWRMGRHAERLVQHPPGYLERAPVALCVSIVELRPLVQVHGELQCSPAESLVHDDLSGLAVRLISIPHAADRPERVLAASSLEVRPEDSAGFTVPRTGQ